MDGGVKAKVTHKRKLTPKLSFFPFHFPYEEQDCSKHLFDGFGSNGSQHASCSSSPISRIRCLVFLPLSPRKPWKCNEHALGPRKLQTCEVSQRQCDTPVPRKVEVDVGLFLGGFQGMKGGLVSISLGVSHIFCFGADGISPYFSYVFFFKIHHVFG